MLKEILKDYNIILASGSPRRQQFFEELGIDFEIRLKPVEEVYSSSLKGAEITDFLAELKAAAFEGELKPNDILITSDTIVWHEDQALEKPKDPIQAQEMLREISGKTHEVITSVCFKTKDNQRTVNASTKVTFANLSEKAIQYYVNELQTFRQGRSLRYSGMDWTHWSRTY